MTALIVVSVIAVIWLTKTAVEYLMPDSDPNVLRSNVARTAKLQNHLEAQHREADITNNMLKELLTGQS